MKKLILASLLAIGLVGCDAVTTTVEPAPVEIVIIQDDGDTTPAPIDITELFKSFKSEVIRDGKGILVTASVDFSDKIDTYAFFVEIVYIDDDDGEDEEEFEKKIYNPIMERDGTLGRTLNFIQEVDMGERKILYVNILYLGDSENVRLNLHEL